MRAQWDNVKSFNLVKECVGLVVEMEKNVEENLGLANQLFRTISEFSSGCPGNQVLFFFCNYKLTPLAYYCGSKDICSMQSDNAKIARL